jgi:hypothetical protein
MYYLPLLFLNYQAGDENLNLEDQSTDTETPLYQFTKTRLYPVRPNPVRGPVNIGFTLGHTHRVQLEVYDLYGRLQQTLIQNQLHAVGEHIQAWDTSHLPAGVYVVSMQVEGQRWAQKVVVP